METTLKKETHEEIVIQELNENDQTLKTVHDKAKEFCR